MTTDLLQHIYGITTGVFITVVCMIVLFGLSYLNRAYNQRITIAFALLALSFVCFGLYNIFYQQTHLAVSHIFYPFWFIKLCAVVTPFSIIILTYIYTRGFSMRSYLAYKLIKRFKWVEYFIYAFAVFIIICMLVLDDIETMSRLLLINFILPSICAIAVPVLSALKNKVALMFAFLFSMLAAGASYMVWLTFTDGLFNRPFLMAVLHLFFAAIVILFGFVAIRFGYKETKAFFYLQALDSFHVLNDIHVAIEEKQFYLTYQPQINLHTQKIESAEALIRWQHPTKGFIPPDKFIALAEEADMIDTITMWVVLNAIKDAKKLLDTGKPTVISVNFSPKNFNMVVVRFVKEQLHKFKLPAEYLKIEITENLLLQEKDIEVQNSVSFLKKMNIPLSIDDYGTGFSSLNYFKKMAIAELKIDQSFIRDLDYDSDNYAIVYSTLQMARNLHLTVVAEGVESEDTIALLKEIGCHKVQGYSISKPLLFNDFIEFIEHH